MIKSNIKHRRNKEGTKMRYTFNDFLNNVILIKIEKHQIKNFLENLPEEISWRSGDKPSRYTPSSSEFPIVLQCESHELSYWACCDQFDPSDERRVVDVNDIIFEETICSQSFNKSIKNFLE